MNLRKTAHEILDITKKHIHRDPSVNEAIVLCEITDVLERYGQFIAQEVPNWLKGK